MATDPTIPKLARYDERDGVVRYRYLSTWYDDGGKRRSKHFGFKGEVNQTQVMARFRNWVLKWRVRSDIRNPDRERPFTVVRLCGAYLRHAGRTFVKEGKPTTHVSNIKYAMRALRDAHGEDMADTFDAPAFARLRESMIHTSSRSSGTLSLKTVNDRMQSISSAYKWAREQGKVSASTVADLLTVARLKKGRTTANAPGKVRSLDETIIRLTMKQMPAPLAAIVELMLLTGMRPGEAWRVRTCDIEMNGDVWLYRPHRSKLEHLDREKVVPLGPRAQVVIKKFLNRDTQAYLFSAAEAQAERWEKKRLERKTPRWPSHTAKRKANPTAKIGAHYTTGSLRKAIHYACKLAGVSPWSTNQLRHTTATFLRKKFGIEVASVQLGHSNLNTTEIYAEKSLQEAMKIAREVG